MSVKDMKVAPFKSYDDIDKLTRNYLLSVAGMQDEDITKLSLKDINDFLLGLYAFEAQRRAEWDDGWVM